MAMTGGEGNAKAQRAVREAPSVCVPLRMEYANRMDETETERRPAPAGWRLRERARTFSDFAGPMYFRDDPASPGVGFYADARHVNGNGVVHGGALLTLADMALFDICIRAVGRFRGATVTLNSEFIAAGRIGAFIEAGGEIIKREGGLLFARGLVSSEGETLMSFSGGVKRSRN